MTFDYFSLLDEANQADILIEKGVFLAERMYKNFMIYLYQIDDFYVEVYHNLNFNMMQGMRSFQDDDALDPFLDTIDISSLYHSQ